jgi:hypothetical protein
MSTTKFIKHFIACIITLIAVSSCANNGPKLSLEEIEEKADFMLLYKKAYDLKNPSSDDKVPEIAGFSLNSEKAGETVMKRDITLYYANGKHETLEANLVFTYAELKNMGNVEIAKQLGPEYIDKIEQLDKDSIYMYLVNGDSIVFDIDGFSFTYTHKGKEIFYPMDKIAFAKKTGLPPRP